MMKQTNGITLISLIITIIIMLILVAVSVRILISSNIIGIAEETANKTKTAYEKESNISEIKVGNKTYSSIQDCIEGNVKKPEIKAGEKAKTNSNYRYTEGEVTKTAVIPAGFTVSGVDTEKTINGGLVIYLIPEGVTVDWDGTSEDENAKTVAYAQENYDQFVWIPVDDINDMYMCQSEDGTKSCKIKIQDVEGKKVAYCTTHNSTAMAGRLYATGYEETFNDSLTTQTYSVNSGLREPAIVTGNSEATYYDNKDTTLGYLNGILGTSFSITTNENNKGTANTDFKTYLQKEYNEVVKSVCKNKGFYVGRYETSNMTEASGTAVKVVKGTTNGINNINWYYMYAQQVKYVANNNLSEDSVGSTMIQGAAYDQVMKFVDTEDYDVTTAGNVGHTSENFTTKPYKTGGVDYSTSYSNSESEPYKDVSKNIYDLEGNMSTMTIEVDDPRYRTCRGGTCGGNDSASYRYAAQTI